MDKLQDLIQGSLSIGCLFDMLQGLEVRRIMLEKTLLSSKIDYINRLLSSARLVQELLSLVSEAQASEIFETSDCGGWHLVAVAELVNGSYCSARLSSISLVFGELRGDWELRGSFTSEVVQVADLASIRIQPAGY